MLALELGLLALLIVTNGLLALSEMAIVSAKRARLQAMADEGNAGATAALRLGDDPSRFLSSVQIGITLVGIVAGVVGGATLSDVVASAIAAVPVVGRWSEAIAFVLVVGAITYLSLVIGELVPKRVAMIHPELVAARVARPMTTLARIASPAVSVLSASGAALLRLLRVREDSGPDVTAEEVEILLAQGEEAGVFEAAERELVSGVLALAERRVSEIMTPRRQIVGIDLDRPFAEQRDAVATSGRTIFPVYRRSFDDIAGIVPLHELWLADTRNAPFDLEPAIIAPIFLPETSRVLDVLDRFRGVRHPFAIVLDEFGGMQGVLTLHDLVEEIAGDFAATGPARIAGIVQRADGSWLVDGGLPAHDLREVLEIDHLPGEDAGEYETVAGFVMTRLGRIPRVTDTIAWAGLTFEVVDMDGNRVDKILVSRTSKEPASA
jgi:putative hemolysin